MVTSAAPSAADWIQAWGGAVAAVGAIALLSVEMLARRRDRAEAALAQARMVIGRLDWPESASGDDTSNAYTYVNWTVANHSAVPVYDVHVFLRDPRPGIADASSVELVRPPRGDVVGPMERVFGSITLAAPLGRAALERLPAEAKPTLGFAFTDAEGRRWSRSGFDPPVRVSE